MAKRPTLFVIHSRNGFAAHWASGSGNDWRTTESCALVTMNLRLLFCLSHMINRSV